MKFYALIFLVVSPISACGFMNKSANNQRGGNSAADPAAQEAARQLPPGNGFTTSPGVSSAPGSATDMWIWLKNQMGEWLNLEGQQTDAKLSAPHCAKLPVIDTRCKPLH